MSEPQAKAPKKRTRISRPYPQHSLEDVLGIAQAIQEKNAGLPFDRVRLAKSMGTTPSSSAFMMKLSSSAKYGLTEGGYNDPRISLTSLGASVTGKDSQDSRLPLVQAAMRPPTFRAFYELLDGKRIPNDDEAAGIIVDDIGVPEPLGRECLGIIVTNGTRVGIVTEVGGSRYVSLSELPEFAHDPHSPGSFTERAVLAKAAPVAAEQSRGQSDDGTRDLERRNEIGNGRIFIAHSGATNIVDSIAKMLNDFDISHGVVDVDPLDSSPLSPTATAEMDECSGAIIVFAASAQDSPDQQIALSRNHKMLLHLGAAFDRFRDRVVKVVGPDVNRDVQTDGIRTIRIQDNRAERFELDLLRELYRTGMIAISVPHRKS